MHHESVSRAKRREKVITKLKQKHCLLLCLLGDNLNLLYTYIYKEDKEWVAWGLLHMS